MEPFYWVLFVFVSLVSVLLVLKILKGLFKLTILSVAFILVSSALVFTYSLVADTSFTGMITGGANFTKEKVNDFVGEKVSEVKNAVISEIVGVGKETVKEAINEVNKEEFLDFVLGDEKKENLINSSNS